MLQNPMDQCLGERDWEEYRFFHILGILSSYAKDPIFLIARNGPVFLKASFLAGWSELMFMPFTYTRSPSWYSMAPPCLLSIFLFITSFVFLGAFLCPFMLLLSLEQICPSLVSFWLMFFLVCRCLDVFWCLQRMEIFLVSKCYLWLDSNLVFFIHFHLFFVFNFLYLDLVKKL